MNSYGALFRLALLSAADLTDLAGSVTTDDMTNENLRDSTFNFRMPGMNLDYMSYCMLAQVNQDKQALLDLETLNHHANGTFATFFQHYVSSNLSATAGGWAYQRIGAILPQDLGPTQNGQPEGNPSPISYTSRTVEAEVATEIKILKMSPLASWLSMSILVWLIITAILVLLVEKQYLARLHRGVNTIAYVAILIARSHAFLAHMENYGTDSKSANADLKTKLGWFRDREGQERWDIELVANESGVKWLDDDAEYDENHRAGRTPQNGGQYALVKPLPMAKEAPLPGAEEPVAEPPSQATH